MTTIRLPHVHRFRDRHGHERHYLRRPGQKSVALPGKPGSPEFLAAYQAGMANAPEPHQPPAGTLNALAAAWLRSTHWRGLKASTRANYTRHLDHLRSKHGDKPIALLDQTGIRRLLTEWGERSATAPQHLLRILRGLCAFGVESGTMSDDPTLGIKRPKHKTTGFQAWTEADIAQFEAHWPAGTRERLAFALLLYTGQRRSDVVLIGRQHRSIQMVQDAPVDCLTITQVKTGNRVMIPVHDALAAELAAVPADRLTYLAHRGRPLSSNGFYNSFIDWCRAAGIAPGLAPHGLRKAMGRRLTEAGATTREAMAILGHTTISEVERYSRSADDSRLAVAAMGRIGKPSAVGKVRERK
jgi:site-specific recombinase XerD